MRNREMFIAIMILVTVCRSNAQSNTEDFVFFTKGQKATVILPITPDEDKGKYYRLDRVENYHIIFEEEPHPKARVPYIIIPNEDFNIDLSSLDLTGIWRDSTNIKGVSFIGTYEKMVVGYKDSFYYYTIDTTTDCYNDVIGYNVFVGALRAFVQIDWRVHNNHNNWEKMPIVLRDNDASTLKLIDYVPDRLNNIYNLNGQRINSLQKGINIINGNKIMVK